MILKTTSTIHGKTSNDIFTRSEYNKSNIELTYCIWILLAQTDGMSEASDCKLLLKKKKTFQYSMMWVIPENTTLVKGVQCGNMLICDIKSIEQMCFQFYMTHLFDTTHCLWKAISEQNWLRSCHFLCTPGLLVCFFCCLKLECTVCILCLRTADWMNFQPDNRHLNCTLAQQN